MEWGRFHDAGVYRVRYGAFLIDVLFCLVLWFMGALMVGSVGFEFNRWNGLALLAAYFGLLPATPLQATPGKRAFGIRIVDLRGNTLTVMRAVARFAISVPSLGLLGLGFVVAAWTQRRQALHDVIAGTLVVGLGDVPREAASPLSWFGRVAAILVVVSSAVAIYMSVEVYDAILNADNSLIRDLGREDLELLLS